jgi:hypothetical protein
VREQESGNPVHVLRTHQVVEDQEADRPRDHGVPQRQSTPASGPSSSDADQSSPRLTGTPTSPAGSPERLKGQRTMLGGRDRHFGNYFWDFRIRWPGSRACMYEISHADMYHENRYIHEQSTAPWDALLTGLTCRVRRRKILNASSSILHPPSSIPHPPPSLYALSGLGSPLSIYLIKNVVPPKFRDSRTTLASRVNGR